ncbi:hypothetical protein NV63_15980 [Elizabethkingia anophelis]|nr:hypothetical protein NV63_15980 [Elizabethkingia anophelis]
MTIQLIDIVFQNDRYYLLFDDNNALEISTNTNEWYVFADDEYLCDISGCNVSETLKNSGQNYFGNQNKSKQTGKPFQKNEKCENNLR